MATNEESPGSMWNILKKEGLANPVPQQDRILLNELSAMGLSSVSDQPIDGFIDENEKDITDKVFRSINDCMQRKQKFNVFRITAGNIRDLKDIQIMQQGYQEYIAAVEVIQSKVRSNTELTFSQRLSLIHAELEMLDLGIDKVTEDDYSRRKRWAKTISIIHQYLNVYEPDYFNHFTTVEESFIREGVEVQINGVALKSTNVLYSTRHQSASNVHFGSVDIAEMIVENKLETLEDLVTWYLGKEGYYIEGSNPDMIIRSFKLSKEKEDQYRSETQQKEDLIDTLVVASKPVKDINAELESLGINLMDILLKKGKFGLPHTPHKLKYMYLLNASKSYPTDLQVWRNDLVRGYES